MMETCFEWMLVVFVGAKVESLFVSLPSVVSFTATGITCQKESAAQCVKVRCLFNPICLLIPLLFFICFFSTNEEVLCLVLLKFADFSLVQFISTFLLCLSVLPCSLRCFSDVDTIPFLYGAIWVSFPICIRYSLGMVKCAVVFGGSSQRI